MNKPYLVTEQDICEEKHFFCNRRHVIGYFPVNVDIHPQFEAAYVFEHRIPTGQMVAMNVSVILEATTVTDAFIEYEEAVKKDAHRREIERRKQIIATPGNLPPAGGGNNFPRR